ncbi:uncharacterized protein RAG0_16675 [Rhynchosporium agropyri]|uniref:Heterokaryon incompatibility domain-containing protein n=1 Tax=Rhynchosporium agropyri TaxID=914238 RepID=A0A1E1LRF8_9HELO|nr:uncharacterized protein RAG0_16675 [Rhynchosporium agropyri]
MPIWIDAVCINQRDRDEKARVVPTMGKIFGEAVEVLVWLGPHRDDNRLAMDMLIWIEVPESQDLLPWGLTVSQLEKIGSLLTDGTQMFIQHYDFEPLGLPPITHLLWPAVPTL